MKIEGYGIYIGVIILIIGYLSGCSTATRQCEVGQYRYKGYIETDDARYAIVNVCKSAAVREGESIYDHDGYLYSINDENVYIFKNGKLIKVKIEARNEKE